LNPKQGSKRLANAHAEAKLNHMDSSLIEDLIKEKKPFQIETASGRIFDAPHRDFISFSRKKTAVIISYEKDGEDHIAIVPLLTVTSTMAKAA
jgi:hypothetical protein